MKNQPLWLDVSRWQGEINFTALSQADETVYGIFSRAGWGEDGGYLDPQFARNWSKSEQFGYYRSSYWAYWDYYPMLHQLDLWYRANPTIDVIPRMWDLEVEAAPSEFLSEQTWLASEEVLKRDGERFIIYSRVDILERTLCKYWTPEQLNMHYYMLAQFDVGDGVEYNGIVVPDFIDPKNILWKQTSDKIPMFTGSGPMDRDRWIWTDVATMHEQIEEMWGNAVTEPETPIELEELQEQVGIDYNVDLSLEDDVSSLRASTELAVGNIKTNTTDIESLTTKTSGLRTDIDSVKIISDNNHTILGETRIHVGELEDKLEDTNLKLVQLERAVGNMATEAGTTAKAFEELREAVDELREEVFSEFEKVWLQIKSHATELDALRLRLSIYEFFKKLFGRD